jgi:ribosomal protein S18 acetylase RimI-like enzyme
MSEPVELAIDRATVAEITCHLARCDGDFLPRLSDRVELPAYAQKICSHATRFEAWANGRLVGLVAAYGGEGAASPTAFVSNVSVDGEFRRRGIAAALLAMCARRAAHEGLQRIELVVDTENAAAMRLYAGCGFVAREAEHEEVVMYLDIGKNGDLDQQTRLQPKDNAQ